MINPVITEFMNNCQNYIEQLIEYEAITYPSAKQLAQNPATMDKFTNYYRISDMCYTFLIDPTARHIGYTINDLNASQIQKFFTTYDPAELFDFFNQQNILNDFIAENELHQPDWFKNDPKYQKAFHTLIAPL